MIEELIAQSWTQWIALVSGIAYVVLAARENNACWVFGIISCSFIAWDDFNTFRLYADGVLQLIYVAMGAYGLYVWLAGRAREGQGRIGEMPRSAHLIGILTCLLLSLPIWILLRDFTDASYGYLDTATTLLSLWATWLLIQKVISNWLYWIAVDAVYVYLFFSTGGELVAVLYIVFLIVAVYGFFEWRRRASMPDFIEK